MWIQSGGGHISKEMKSYKDIVNILEQTSNKSVVFTFGRFQPPTSGHQLLINKVIKEARKRRAEHRIYPSHSHDAKQNPLSHKDKVLYMRKLFPKANIIDDKKAVNPFNVLESLSEEGYKNVYFVVGGDRVSEFEKSMKKYVGKDGYDFDVFEVLSAGKRDPDAEGVVGMSGSKMRKAAQDKEFESFLKGVPNKTPKRVSLGLFKAIRKGMGLQEQIPGPGIPCPPPADACPKNNFCMCTDDSGVVWECNNLPTSDGGEGSGCAWVKCTHNCGPESKDDEININKVASNQYNVRVADTDETRAKGLMHETHLDENDGMLFVFDEENYHGIWMKNTHIPLDVVWINESGTIVDVQTMQPHDLNTHIPNEPAKYVLEVNAGTFDGAIGDTIAERTLLRKLKMDKFSRSERKRKKKIRKANKRYSRNVLGLHDEVELDESVQLDEADNTAAVARQVKKAVKKYTTGKLVVRSKGGKARFIAVVAHGNIDNKLRKMMADVMYPKANIKDKSNISYGNISDKIISASADHWVKALGLKESVDDNFENFLTELSIQSRRKMARAAKRTAKRRAAKRKIKARRMKSASDLKTKSRKAAIMGFRSKMLKGRSWSGLSHSEKENITKRMKKKYKPARIAKVAQKLLPGIRKGERERIAAIKGNKNEQVEYLTEPQALENLVKKLRAEGMGKSKAYAIATAQLQKSGVLKKGTHELEERNYKLEYANYQGKPEQIERRSSRNKARRIMTGKGLCKMGDGMDVDHKDRNPLNNDIKNLRVQKKEKNRSFCRKVENGKPLEDGTSRTAKYHRMMTPGQFAEQAQADRVREKHRNEKEAGKEDNI